MNNFSFTRSEILIRLKDGLKSIDEFKSHKEDFTYSEFDYYTSHSLKLFYVEPDFDFVKVSQTLDALINALPAIKRIFSKPIITLEDIPEVLPVEIVSRFDNNTFTYLGTHSNDVEDIKNNGEIKPRKLLTKIYEDYYSIYENVIFANFIEETMKYLRISMLNIENILSIVDIMGFNLLDRSNHTSYFLALGKLHTSYRRDFDAYLEMSKSLFNKIEFILAEIKPRLKKPVYAKNKGKKRHLALKKTNIFTMQKDYKKIYNLYKYYIKNNLIKNDLNEEEIEKVNNDYVSFNQVMAIFAAGHFNFETKLNDKIAFDNFNIDFAFKKWNLNISSPDNKCIILNFLKDRNYKILLKPTLEVIDDDELSSLIAQYNCNEGYFTQPFSNDFNSKNKIFISMDDVDSFRRIQQLLLKGMVYSDKSKDECPFCHSILHYDDKTHQHICENCGTIIKDVICATENKQYTYTSIKNHALKDKNEVINKKPWDKRTYEGNMFFRNITKIDEYNRLICPICNKPTI